MTSCDQFNHSNFPLYLFFLQILFIQFLSFPFVSSCTVSTVSLKLVCDCIFFISCEVLNFHNESADQWNYFLYHCIASFLEA